jgi:hypothetical protein
MLRSPYDRTNAKYTYRLARLAEPKPAASEVPDEATVGSKVIVNEPVQGSTGLPLGVKPDAVK